MTGGAHWNQSTMRWALPLFFQYVVTLLHDAQPLLSIPVAFCDVVPFCL